MTDDTDPPAGRKPCALRARAADEAAEGRRIRAELLDELREIPGVAGAHLMAPRQEAAIAGVIAASGVLADRVA